MCGIVGFITPGRNGFSSRELDIFKELTYASALRGVDSTGMFYVTNDGDVQVHKDILDSSSFLKTNEFGAAGKEIVSKGRAAVAHCRAATKGSKTEENAHPFIVDNHIVLVHNGTLFDHRKVANTEVDSHAIAHRLAEEEDVGKALQQINGAYALVWYDVKREVLNVIRNDQRPLYICELESGAIGFASEPGMLYWVMGRNQERFQKEGAPYLLKEGTHMQFALKEYRNDKFQTWEEKDIKYNYHQAQKSVGNVVPFQPPTDVAPITIPSVQRQATKVLGSESYITALGAAELIGHGEWQPVTTVLKSGATKTDFMAFQDYAKPHKEYLLEVIDYCCQDTEDPNCDLYHIYGNVIDPNATAIDGFAAYWEISAKDEETVMQYATNGKLFTGKVEYFLNRPHSLLTGVRTVLCKFYGVQPVDAIKTPESVQ